MAPLIRVVGDVAFKLGEWLQHQEHLRSLSRRGQQWEQLRSGAAASSSQASGRGREEEESTPEKTEDWGIFSTVHKDGDKIKAKGGFMSDAV